MTRTTTEPHPPKRLLLATDLSGRCDRALDRAVQLATSWSAELVAVNVLDVGGTPAQVLAWASGASDDILRDLAYQELKRNTDGVTVPLSLRVERGSDCSEVIRRVANEVRAELIVSSVARNEFLGRFLLGSTVEQLAQTVTQPLLVVRQRAQKPYRRVLVATNLSPDSKSRLQTAARFFPGMPIDLYHAHDVPLGGLGQRGEPSKSATTAAFTACQAVITAADLPPDTAVRIHCERGAVTSTLPAFAHANNIDLVVMGVEGGSSLVNNLLGSPAMRLLEWLPCDVMLVPSV